MKKYISSSFLKYCTTKKRNIISKDSQLIVYGAGVLGQKIMQALNYQGIPFRIADDIKHSKNLTYFGEVVKKLSDFDKEKKFLVIICMFSPKINIENIQKQVKSTLNSSTPIYFTELLPFLPDSFFPWYSYEKPRSVIRNIKHFEELEYTFTDNISRKNLKEYIQLLSTGNSQLLYNHDPINKLPFELKQQYTFIDCGAYTGDTVISYYSEYHNAITDIIAIEPDPSNFSALVETSKELIDKVNISLINKAISSKVGYEFFRDDNGMGSMLHTDGNIKVETTTLQEVTTNSLESNYLIKMDIEGQEVQTIEGSKEFIISHKPILIISVYHSPQDLLTIHKQLMAFGYTKFYLRAFGFAGIDLMLFAK